MDKLTILYDISIILMGEINNSNRTGIYFCADSILREMLKRQDINILLYARPIVSSLAEEYAEKKIGIGGKNIVTSSNIDIIISKLWTKIEKIRFKKKSNKIVYYSLCAFKTILERIAVLEEKRKIKINESDYVFFSPMEQAPDFLCKNSAIKKCIIVHDVITYIFPEYFPRFKSKLNNHWLKKVVEKKVVNVRYFANSEYTKSDFVKISNYASNENVDCIYHACRDFFSETGEKDIINIRTKYGIPMDKKYVFSLCSIEPRKNLPRILKTFFEFVEKNNIEDLVFVLGGTTWNSFEKTFSSEMDGIKRNSDKLIKIGYVDDEDLCALYSGAYWFVYTSQYEGFGVPPLEAANCGCPIIVSDSSSIPEVIGDAGVYVKWDSDEEHIKAYEKYYFDNEYRITMGKKGKEQARKYSWEKTTDSIINTIKSYDSF